VIMNKQITLVNTQRKNLFFVALSLLTGRQDEHSSCKTSPWSSPGTLGLNCSTQGKAERRTEEVGKHRQCPDAESTKRSCCRNVTVQFMNHRLLTMSTHDHLLLLQLLCHLPTVTHVCHYIRCSPKFMTMHTHTHTHTHAIFHTPF